MEKENLTENFETTIENEIEAEASTLTDVNPEETTETNSLEGTTVIEITNLTKSFGKKKILNNLNLTVNAGEIYGIIGSDASGKTTLAKTIVNLIRPNSGTVVLNGYDTTRDFYNAMDTTGIVLENPSFYPYLTAYDNLAMLAGLHKRFMRKRIDRVLAIVNLTDNANLKVSLYSKGMLQRLAIAAALLNNPSVVIMDSPTNGLNVLETKEINNLIKNLSKEDKITFLILTNNLNDIASLCTKVSILSEGEIKATSSVEELINNNEDMMNICKAQASLEKFFVDITDKGGNKID